MFSNSFNDIQTFQPKIYVNADSLESWDSLGITNDNHNGNNNDDDKKLPHCEKQYINCRKVSAPENYINDDDEDNAIEEDIHNKDDNGSNNSNNDHNDGYIISIKNENPMQMCDIIDLMPTES